MWPSRESRWAFESRLLFFNINFSIYIPGTSTDCWPSEIPQHLRIDSHGVPWGGLCSSVQGTRAKGHAVRTWWRYHVGCVWVRVQLPWQAVCLKKVAIKWQFAILCHTITHVIAITGSSGNIQGILYGYPTLPMNAPLIFNTITAFRMHPTQTMSIGLIQLHLISIRFSKSGAM